MRKMLFSGSPEGRNTLVPSFVEGTEIALSWVCADEEGSVVEAEGKGVCCMCEEYDDLWE